MDFYIHAATILDDLSQKKGSIKQLVFNSKKHDPKRTYALVCETLKYKHVLDEVIQCSKLLDLEKKIKKNLARVLVHDLLMSKRGISASTGSIKEAILRHKTRLNAEFVKLKIRNKVKSHEELALKNPVTLPRWIRINTIKATKEEVLKQLALTRVSSLKEVGPGTYYMDEIIDNLIALDGETSLVNESCYQEGKVIIQDKASCIPAAILGNQRQTKVGDIIDGCAAPGNKTTHLAALFPNAKIFAFERNSQRVQTLQKMVEISGAQNVEILHQDFTQSDIMDPKFANVTHILLDPSCSGSGIVSRQDFLLEESEQDLVEDVNRLESLCSFQSTILKHALQFPKCQYVTYSTCSVHRLENEQVVCDVLSQEPQWKCNTIENTLPQWEDRGIPEYCTDPMMAKAMIRCVPGKFGTIGFFVCNLYHSGRVGNLLGNGTSNALESNAKRKRKNQKKKNYKKMKERKLGTAMDSTGHISESKT
ncbi:rRNA methyltransferase [Schizosaccharomyces cryophilus OY26]|uniref:rRNA methyltransferase n=1 Tax=Schizosaccharomyces cryophilus (strain OY26 / ATCC MYA-4695 / CBS 11777 / NBRC 106824 / NRRL Y48691) TaxID=653667 RepID=S9XDX9_SCHCR|nr:rRNA methyltransferase [Schizosaccharomyces cryophilus OY26]EPY51986.1 rRNA methyltransferase [Schizosaccharomyces cryophilus OY26]